MREHSRDQGRLEDILKRHPHQYARVAPRRDKDFDNRSDF